MKIKICILTIVTTFFLSIITANTYSASPIIIVIDPGHGGIDPGAKVGSIKEKEINLDISKRVQALLTKKGYKVILTRSGDSAVYKKRTIASESYEKDLRERVNIFNNNRAKLFVSIHTNNALKYPSANGSIVYYNENSAASKKLSLFLQKSLNSVKISSRKRTSHQPRTAGFYVLKHSNIPGVLVETGFLSNSRERKALTTAIFRQNLAKSIANGLEQYLKSKG